MKVVGYEHSMIYFLSLLGLLYCHLGYAGMMLEPAPERLFDFHNETKQSASFSGLSQPHFDSFEQSAMTQFEWRANKVDLSQGLAAQAGYQDVLLLKQFLGDDVQRVKNEYTAVKQAMQQWVQLNQSYVDIATMTPESNSIVDAQDNVIPLQGRDTEIANDGSLVQLFTQTKKSLQQPSNIVLLVVMLVAGVITKRRWQSWRQQQAHPGNALPKKKKKRKRVRIKRA
ncbi:hypothetical protein [Motilimonas pumila]|uniref:Uncharacterized protein n=1 Tax=Motilimonas pumila TaxID=2303987 RepID=A0A418YIW6_9GAMM|nr:hypothetical protein [Motilimonas pumila]RJG50552.1 hypothetical protein D1Z90_03480 [Motilimonas pumila]